MISSLEDAVPFFMFWKNERTLLHAILAYDGMSLLGLGHLSDCSEEDFEYRHPDGDFRLRVRFASVTSVAFMTPDDFHGGKVRKGTGSVPLKHGWILHTECGGSMNFFEESAAAAGAAGEGCGSGS